MSYALKRQELTNLKWINICKWAKILSTKTADRQVYNFEYFMNRAYAYTRDKGKCRVCSNPLKEHARNCHHVRNSLPINEINKVPNLAWICVKCHEYIHGMTIPIKTTKEIKIKACKEKLKVLPMGIRRHFVSTLFTNIV